MMSEVKQDKFTREIEVKMKEKPRCKMSRNCIVFLTDNMYVV